MVVDTMVFVYALLGVEPFRAPALRVLEEAPVIVVPDLMRSELANVFWKWVRQRGVPATTAQDLLWDAEALVTKHVAACDVWEHALELAVGKGHPVYDTLFVAVAELHEMQVVTFDRKLKELFPEQVLLASEGV